MPRITLCAALILTCLVSSSCSALRKSGRPEASSAAAGTLGGVPVPASANPKLVNEISSWLGTPYKYGGQTRSGVDCSGFIGQVFQQVYQVSLPRTTAQMHRQASAVATPQLREGDLVFFKIDTKEAGHAGIYLWDGHFAHASTSRGVMLSRLSESYWQRYFIGGGRWPVRVAWQRQPDSTAAGQREPIADLP